MRRARWLAILGVVYCGPGCAMSLGPTVGREARVLSGGGRVATIAGVRFSQQVQPARDRGVLLGYELGVEGQQGDDAGPGLRALGVVGWADTPHSYKPIVGHELALRLGYTGFPDRTGYAHAFAFGPRLALPIRVSPSEEPWDADHVIGRTFMLVPDLSGTVALAPGHAPRLDTSVGLSLRLHLWTGWLP